MDIYIIRGGFGAFRVTLGREKVVCGWMDGWIGGVASFRQS